MVLSAKKDKPINPPYFLFTLLFALFLLFSLFATEAINIFQDGTEMFMNDIEFYSATLMSITLGILVIIFAKRFFIIRMNWVALILLLVLFMANTYAIFSFPSTLTLNDGYVYSVSLSEKIHYAFSFVNVVLTIYVYFVIAPQCKLTEGGWNGFLAVVSIVAFTAILYSYYSDKDVYMNIFCQKPLDMHANMKSFTNSKNTFGVLILFGVFSEIYLFAMDKKWWRLPLIIYYFASIFLTLSKTSIVCAIFVMIASALYWFIKSLSGCHKTMSIVLFSLFVITLGVLAYLLFHSELFEDSFVGNVLKAIKKALLNPEGSTLEAREIIWKKLFALVNSDTKFLIFGLGDANFPFAFAFASDTLWKYSFYTHNGFLEMLGRGGLIRLSLYIALIIYTFYLVLTHLSSKKSKCGWLYLIFFVTFLMRSMVETEFLLGNDLKSILWSLYTIVPLIAIRYEEKRSEAKKNLIKEYCSSSVPIQKSCFSSKIIDFLLSIFVGAIPTLLMLMKGSYINEVTGFSLLGISALFGVLFFALYLKMIRSDGQIAASIIVTMLFVFISALSAYFIGVSLNGAIYPYTICCFSVSCWVIYLSLIFIIDVISPSFSFPKLVLDIERRYRYEVASKMFR